MVLYPAAAATCAMPEPMRPQPSTPTVLIGISFSDRFYDGRDALAAADARRRQTAFLAPAPQLEDERQQQPRARHAEWMAERNRAAVHVHFVSIEAELFFDG